MTRSSLIIIMMLLFMNCSKKESDRLLKQEQIQLAQPRLSTMSTIIDSSITLIADFKMKGAELYYTNDGTLPTINSSLYTKPLQITTEGTYTFRAFHPDWKPSNTVAAKAYKKGKTPYSINWQTQANSKYKGMGQRTLINHKKATFNFNDLQWLGYDTIAKANIHFKKALFLNKITIGYLVDTNSWIFPPESVSVLLNATDTLHISIPKLAKPTIALKDLQIPIEKEIDSLSITINNLKKIPGWHAGAGIKAWLFMDEWIFN